MKFLIISILFCAVFISAPAQDAGLYSYGDSSHITNEDRSPDPYNRNSKDKFVLDFQVNALYLSARYEFLEIQFNLVPHFSKNMILQIASTYGIYETDRVAFNVDNYKHSVYSYSFGAGSIFHFLKQEFILLLNYADKSYITNQASSSKLNSATYYLSFYDNLGSKKVRFLTGVRYYLKNIAIRGKEEKWAINLGIGLNF
jgi:hypothetical protein